MDIKNVLHTQLHTTKRACYLNLRPERLGDEKSEEGFSKTMQFYDNDILALCLMIPWRVQSYKYVENELTTALISFYYLPWFFLDATQSSVVS